MRPAVLTVTAIALLIFPFARAADVDDLRAAVLKELKAFGGRDCKTVIGLRTDPTVAYLSNNPEPVESGKAESLKRCANGTFANWAEWPEATAVYTPNYQYRVMGTTGLVYGRLKAVLTPKTAHPTFETRRMETWVKSDGQWQRAALVSWCIGCR